MTDYTTPVAQAVTTAEVLAENLKLPLKTLLIKAYRSKTIWFSTAVTAFGAVEALLPATQSIIGSHVYGVILTGVGIATAVLRFVTAQAIADK